MSAAVGHRRGRHRTRWVALGVGAVVSVLAVVLALQVGDDQLQAQPRSELLGDPAPGFALETLTGGRVDLAELRGKAVIVNFWNSWCRPCRQEEPTLRSFYERHAGEADFALVGIVRDDSDDAARRAAETRGLAWPIALDPDGRAALDFGTRGQPETFAIDTRGEIVGVQYGPATIDDLEVMLARARGAG